MKLPERTKRPEMLIGIPVWCHHHGWKLSPKKPSLRNGKLQLTLVGSAVRLTITRQPFPLVSGLLVCWKIKQNIETGSSGRVIFTPDQLRAAFGLIDTTGKFSQGIINQYGAESAVQGKYIRWKNFLNIPCPGTGMDGDPNISVHYDFSIQEAVRIFLERC